MLIFSTHTAARRTQRRGIEVEILPGEPNTSDTRRPLHQQQRDRSTLAIGRGSLDEPARRPLPTQPAALVAEQPSEPGGPTNVFRA